MKYIRKASIQMQAKFLIEKHQYVVFM